MTKSKQIAKSEPIDSQNEEASSGADETPKATRNKIAKRGRPKAAPKKAAIGKVEVAEPESSEEAEPVFENTNNILGEVVDTPVRRPREKIAAPKAKAVKMVAKSAKPASKPRAEKKKAAPSASKSSPVKKKARAISKADKDAETIKTPTKEKAAKQPKKRSSPKSSSKFGQMVMDAVRSLAGRRGASLRAIKGHIVLNNQIDYDAKAVYIRMTLKRFLNNGALINTRGKGLAGSFKIAKK